MSTSSSVVPTPSVDQMKKRKKNPIASSSNNNGAAVVAVGSSRPPKLLRTNSSKEEEEDAAATRVQKMFKGHRTRRSLADCAIVMEEMWWKLYESASLDRSSVSFFGRGETAASRWLRAGKRIARLGKGLCRDGQAQKLALRHWLEAIDPRHRYGHNLHLYYLFWLRSSSTQPFFYWLDVGAGREVHHPCCPRARLNAQLVAYLGHGERAAYRVEVRGDGRLAYMLCGALVHTTGSTTDKWIFVLSTDGALYVGQKSKGRFQHSSFLAGGATSAAGRLVAEDGVLKAIWPYSGHYLPTEDNFNHLIAFLRSNRVDLTHVKRCSVDDDECPSLMKKQQAEEEEAAADHHKHKQQTPQVAASEEDDAADAHAVVVTTNKWSSGAGARIGCVRDYPAELQSRALEQVNLSPRTSAGDSMPMDMDIPRPPTMRLLSPRAQFAYMGMGVRPPPEPKQQQWLPTVHLTLPRSRSSTKATTSLIAS